MRKSKPIIVVQGAQWGSEGKGMVSAALTKERGVDIAVRTGTVNAGHTIYYHDHPRPFKMQQLPTAWAEDPDVVMVLGPGAYIHPEILHREIGWIHNTTGVRPVVLVDRNCGIHMERHTDRSKQSGRHHSMGATGKGCSEAVIDKIRLRGSGDITTFRQWCDVGGAIGQSLRERISFVDASEYLNAAYRQGQQILIEGTQGSHLDIHLGPYPYTTHKQTQAAQWAMEAGLGLDLEYEIIMVARTYPIRVAGNSGPMPREITWPDLSRRITSGPGHVRPEIVEEWERACASFAERYNMTKYEALNQHRLGPNDRDHLREGLSELHKDALNAMTGPQQLELKKLFEFTTVTNKLRRVAEWDADVVRKAIEWNGGPGGRMKICISFWNYWEPQTWGSTGPPNGNIYLNSEMLTGVESDLNTVVSYITTGPKTENFIKVR